MQSSEATNELDAALAKTQVAMGAAAKDSNNPFFRSKYADLASCWDAWRPHGPANGLSLQQFPVTRFERLDPPIQVIQENGKTKTIHFVQYVGVETRLCHSSGQWKSEFLEVLVKDDSPQATGLGVTYARRITMCAVCGIAPEDDDGNAAANGNPDLGAREGVNPPKPKPPAATLPDCPQCGKKGTTIVGKQEFGGGLVCFKNGGCKASWETPEHPFVGEKAQRRAAPEKKLSEAIRSVLTGMKCATREQSSAVLSYCTGKTLEEVEQMSPADSAAIFELLEQQIADRKQTLVDAGKPATKPDAMISIRDEAYQSKGVK